jgi:hypothetical protein
MLHLTPPINHETSLDSARPARPLIMGRDIARNNRRLDTGEFLDLNA